MAFNCHYLAPFQESLKAIIKYQQAKLQRNERQRCFKLWGWQDPVEIIPCCPLQGTGLCDPTQKYLYWDLEVLLKASLNQAHGHILSILIRTVSSLLAVTSTPTLKFLRYIFSSALQLSTSIWPVKDYNRAYFQHDQLDVQLPLTITGLTLQSLPPQIRPFPL